MSDTRELGAILRTLEEVEASLERRSARAAGANVMIWGIVTGSIFLFYQLVAWNREPYAAALGPALPWIWLAPIALGFAASAAVGARLGRVGADPETRARYRRGMVPGIVATALAALLVALGQGAFVPGALLVAVGLLVGAYARIDEGLARACLTTAAVFVVAGAVLMVWRGPSLYLAAALVMGGGLLALGAWTYAHAR